MAASPAPAPSLREALAQISAIVDAAARFSPLSLPQDPTASLHEDLGGPKKRKARARPRKATALAGGFGGESENLNGGGGGESLLHGTNAALLEHHGDPDFGDPIPPDVIDYCAAQPHNDVGNGKRLLAHFGDKILHVRDVGWHFWTGTHWSLYGGEEAVTRFAQLTAARIALEAGVLSFTKREQEAVEVGEIAEEALAKLRGELLERSEEDRKAEERRLLGIIAAGAVARKALAGRKGKKVDFARQSGNSGKIEGMIKQALPHKTVAPAELDKDALAFNVEDGTLRFVMVPDIDDPDDSGKKVRLVWSVRKDPHNPGDLISKCAPVSYDEEAKCPAWDAFLQRVQPDRHMRDFLRDYHGYGLTGRNSMQAFIFNTGGGANGKSTYIEAVMRVFGNYGGTLNPESMMNSGPKQGNQATPDIADLPSVRLLRISELPEGAKLQENLIKALTGGEPIKARHNYEKRFFTFYPVFKASMSGNSKPQLHDTSEGLWRRVMIVPWNVMIPREERKEFEEMQELFAAERSGILNWLIAGACAFLQAGSRLKVPEQVLDATAEHRDDMDPIGQFLSSCCERQPGAKMPGGLLYRYYEAWCHESGLKPLHQTLFGRNVPKHGWTKIKLGTVQYLDMVMHEDAPKPAEERGFGFGASNSGPRDPP